MDELDQTFRRELEEVLHDVVQDCWTNMGDVEAKAQAFFFKFADGLVAEGGTPEDPLANRLATSMLFMFMAGREHAARGYRTPIPKEVVPDEMPAELEDLLERMFNTDDE